MAVAGAVRFLDEGSESSYRGGPGEGHAAFVFNDGKKYVGGWKDNEQHGVGIMQYPSKSRDVEYSGEWHNGKRQGVGKYTWECGSVYEGEWKDGMKHGKGKYTLSSGDSYEGDFVEDRWEGRGKHTIVQVCEVSVQVSEWCSHAPLPIAGSRIVARVRWRVEEQQACWCW